MRINIAVDWDITQKETHGMMMMINRWTEAHLHGAGKVAGNTGAHDSGCQKPCFLNQSGAMNLSAGGS
ncbi:MAG TPA: hypothetical protein HA272_07740 [Methanoregula sp.]|nr:hypothetical protein [Methanoregula sp.]